MIRLKDIALAAGVSIMTVSKVLRDAPDISAATKARIRVLAQQMGYQPDTAAQGLRSRTTRLFGVIISASTNPFIARVMMALEEQAHEMGYELILAHSLNLPEREETLIRRFLSRRIDGLFLSPVYRMDPHAPIYDELLRLQMPTVLLGHRASFCSKFANVESDDTAGSYQATRHLLELGHRKIAFLAGPQVVPAAQERLEGYRRALREAELEQDDRLVFAAGSTIEEGEAAAQQLLQENTGATAVQATNDLVAIGAANVLMQKGLRIPGDLSMLGFGNILTSEHFRVPLTTVRQPKMALGLAAMDSMRKLLRKEPAETVRLGTELIIRQSTAAPSKVPASPG